MRSELEDYTKPEDAKANYISSETFFEVNFEKVPTLAENHSVYVNNGKAYVPMSEQIHIILQLYKDYLERTLEVLVKR